MATGENLAFGVERSKRRYRLRLARYQALAETVAAHVSERTGGDPEPLVLLDIGSGSGRSLRYIEAQGVSDRISFVGMDVNERRLTSIFAPERWRLVQADAAEPLPFAPASFDVVVCEQLLEHLSHPEQLMAEIGRVVRPGGLVIVGAPIFPPGVPLLRKGLVALRARLFGIVEGHVQTFTCADIVRLVRASGVLDVREIRGMRILSGGLVAPLENFHGWYRLNRWLGRRLPWLCTEVQIVAKGRTHERAAPAQ